MMLISRLRATPPILDGRAAADTDVLPGHRRLRPPSASRFYCCTPSSLRVAFDAATLKLIMSSLPRRHAGRQVLARVGRARETPPAFGDGGSAAFIDYRRVFAARSIRPHHAARFPREPAHLPDLAFSFIFSAYLFCARYAASALLDTINAFITRNTDTS